MPGYSFLNKKEFHTGSFKNIEKVWLAEQHKAEQERNIAEHRKRLMEERYEEELKKYKVQAGLIPESELHKMDWMYNHGVLDKDKNIAEEYLMGKPVEEQPSRTHVVKESATNEANEDFSRAVEDPLLVIKKQELKKANGNFGNSDLSYYIGVKNERSVQPEEYISQLDRRGKKIEKLKTGERKVDSNAMSKLVDKYLKEKMGPFTTIDKDSMKLRFNALKQKTAHLKRPSIIKSEKGYRELENNAKEVDAYSDNYYRYVNNKGVNSGSNPKFISEQIKSKYNIEKDRRDP